MNALTLGAIKDIVGPLELDPVALRRKYDRERDKRIVSEGNGQYIPATDGKFADFGKDPWVDPNFDRLPIVDHSEVIVAGGGFGGPVLGSPLP